MCLYETKIKNPHYLENEKNGGIPPRLDDWRKQFIKIGCGWCEECRKKLARDWKIRLYEEYKDNKKAEFVTLSFSAESIKKLEKELKESNYRGIEGENTDVNILAAFAIRRFTERWRKKYKKAPRHWLVTELGHINSERIHLHGIIWQTHEKTTKKEFQQDIENIWQYGNVWIGQYVSEKTYNYITKYITKTDTQHQGYKQRIFVSKGIGKGYIERTYTRHIYNGIYTETTYKCGNGIKYQLPRYYKTKLWNEEEREALWTIELDKEKIYLNKQEYNIYEDDEEKKRNFYQLLESKRTNSERAGYGNEKTINKTYIITSLMKMDYGELKQTNKDNITKCVKRREITNSKKNIDKKDLSKDWKTEKIIYGKYIGTTTAAQRKYNKLIEEAQEKKVTIRQLRLIKKGII